MKHNKNLLNVKINVVLSIYLSNNQRKKNKTVSTEILSSTAVFTIDDNKKSLGMISERSCDSEVMAAENSALASKE